MKAVGFMALASGAVTVAALVACASSTYLSEPTTYSGAELFEVYCASCHGPKGQGNGPVAPLLKAPVPNLARLAARNGGKFPEDEVFRHIDGQAGDPTHGPRNMPVWGYEFYGNQDDDEEAHEQATKTIERLVKHVRSLQRAF